MLLTSAQMSSLQAEDAKKLNEALGMFGNPQGRDSDDTDDADSGDDSDFKATIEDNLDDGSSTEEESEATPTPKAKTPEPKVPSPKKVKKAIATKAAAGRGRGGRGGGRGAKTTTAAAGKTKAPPKAKPKKLEQQKIDPAPAASPAKATPPPKAVPPPAGPPKRTASIHPSELALKFKVAAQAERIKLYAKNMAMIKSMAEINGQMLLEGIPEEMEGVINSSSQ